MNYLCVANVYARTHRILFHCPETFFFFFSILFSLYPFLFFFSLSVKWHINYIDVPERISHADNRIAKYARDEGGKIPDDDNDANITSQ